jgi:hypothetical protein
MLFLPGQRWPGPGEPGRIEPYDSRYVYGVSCRVRAKSYPKENGLPNSPQ